MALDEARELDADITLRRMTLTRRGGSSGGSSNNDSGGEARLVCHYQYHAWPDHGIPETTRPLRRLAHLLVSKCSERSGLDRTGELQPSWHRNRPLRSVSWQRLGQRLASRKRA